MLKKVSREQWSANDLGRVHLALLHLQSIFCIHQVCFVPVITFLAISTFQWFHRICHFLTVYTIPQLKNYKVVWEWNFFAWFKFLVPRYFNDRFALLFSALLTKTGGILPYQSCILICHYAFIKYVNPNYTSWTQYWSFNWIQFRSAPRCGPALSLICCSQKIYRIWQAPSICALL